MASRIWIFVAIIAFSVVGHANNKSEVIKKRVQEFIASIAPCEKCKNPLTREAGEQPLGQTTIKDLHGDDIPMTVMNDEYVLKLFQEMTVQRKIPFGYPEDGCYARAHEMAYQFDQMDIHSGKVFATGVFRIENSKAKNGVITWGFHVAPFVLVDDGKVKKPWVIDPSLFYEPVPIERWLEKLTEHPAAKLKEVFLTNRYIYHLRHKDRRLQDFDPEDLRAARKVMKKYLKKDDKRTRRASAFP